MRLMDEVRYDAGYAHFSDGWSWPMAIMIALRLMISSTWARLVCRIRGHKLEEEIESAEDGHSTLGCVRCGWWEDIWM